MDSLQKKTLEQFMKIMGKKTFQQYADITGIEKTRIFRLVNGAEMKLKEFEVFQAVINRNQKNGEDWKRVLSEVELNRACEGDALKREVSLMLERNERLKHLLAA